MKQKFKIATALILFTATLLIGCGDKKSKTATIATTYTVDAYTNHEYEFNSAELVKATNPNLTLKRGETYEFVIETYDHPFYIKTAQVSGKENAYDDGVTNNGAREGSILFTVPKDAPSVLYYVCKYHKMMSGELKIVD